jgi:hypothetical protein
MGAYKLVPRNEVALGCVPEGGIALWDSAPFLLGRSAGPGDGFAFPMNLSQLSSRHCTLRASGEVGGAAARGGRPGGGVRRGARTRAPRAHCWPTAGRVRRRPGGRAAAGAPARARSSEPCPAARGAREGARAPRASRRRARSKARAQLSAPNRGRRAAQPPLPQGDAREWTLTDTSTNGTFVNVSPRLQQPPQPAPSGHQCARTQGALAAGAPALAPTRPASLRPRPAAPPPTQGHKIGKGNSHALKVGDVVDLSIVHPKGSAAQQQQPQGVQ